MYSFIVPIKIVSGDQDNLEYFKMSMESIFSQTDSRWQVIAIDDYSCNRDLDYYFKEIQDKYPGKIEIHRNLSNKGPGISRNIGVKIASELGSKVVMFHDGDDISHPNRVEMTRKLFNNENVDLVYSKFIPIDENNNTIELNKLSPSIRDILLALKENPPVGKGVWKTIGIQTGYINLTSCTSVKTDIALASPFPDRRASEDAYTWMIYSAKGAGFCYCENIPSLYRIPQKVKESSSRTNLGLEKFYRELGETNEEAFLKCIDIAIQNGEVQLEEKSELMKLFYKQLASTLTREGMVDIAQQYLGKYLIQ